jgi:hypothetical protein
MLHAPAWKTPMPVRLRSNRTFGGKIMLSPEEIEKIKEQEAIRLQLRKELTPEKRRGFWELLNSQFALWLLGSVVLSGVTYYWNHKNDDRVAQEKNLEKVLITQREDSQFLLQLLPSLTHVDHDVRLRAVDVIKTRYPEDKIPIPIQRLMANIITEATSLPDLIQPEETKRLIASAVSSLDKLSQPDPAVTATFQQLPARVYLQIFSEQQREKAKEIQLNLGKQGFIVPGIENVQDKSHPVKETQIRYFNESDKDSANKVKDVLNQNGYSKVEVLSVPLKVKPKPGTIEVWFATSD